MKENLLITERDLFNYIFFKKSTEEKKLRLLEEVAYDLNSTLTEKIKKCLSENLTLTVKNRINNFIKYYKPILSITLNLVKETKTGTKSKKPSNGPDNKFEISKSTYIDNDNIYMARLINYEDGARIFLFSRDEEKMNNCTLILRPGNESFEIINNLLPLEVNHRITATVIVLKFT